MAESLATYLASIRSAIQSVGADVGELRKRFGRGTTAQRPTAAAVGDGALWFDTTSGALMAVVNGAWVASSTMPYNPTQEQIDAMPVGTYYVTSS